MTHELALLGTPTLLTPGGTLAFERKTAAVLAYLALEGSVPKYRLAGLLWPESGEAAAKNNMRQLLRRLRLAGADIITGHERIALRGDVEVDVKRLSFLTTPSLEFLRQDSELLDGLEFDDAPDFAEWLYGAREELRVLKRRGADLEAARLESVGNFRGALDYAEACLRLEPLSEEAHRRMMRLDYLLGDRAAALAAFERCKRVLARELGTEPLPETLELARLIARGEGLKDAPPGPKETRLPTAVLRPPVLAGREREWRQMEAAWQAKKIILVTGEAGSGKTRLVEEFAASKGATVRIDGRPGDTGVPYASQARVLRTLLAHKPDLTPGSGPFEPWVWRELARLLPELGDAPPLLQEAERLRFFEAVGLVVAHCTRDLSTVVVDDLQFYDDHTVALAAYYQNQPYAQAADMPPHITVFRRGELSESTQAIADELVETGLAVLVELGPLSAQAVGTLLDGLGLAGTEQLVPGLSRYTGGNPVFILETLKHLIETDTLALGLPSRLAPPGKLAALINKRLGRLSPQALNLARTAAVAGTSFDLRLAEHVLERPAMELAEAHAELEAAQMFRGNAFTHDLVFEVVLLGIPGAVVQVLNSRTAQYLETLKAHPALVAQHWLEALEPARAEPWLLAAASNAHSLGLFEEALKLFEQLLDTAANPPLRLRALVGLAQTLVALNRTNEAETLIGEVLQQASDPELRVSALDSLQGIRVGQGRYLEAERIIDEALPLARSCGDPELGDNLQFSKGFLLTRQGRHKEALAVLEPLLPRFRLRPPSFKRFHLASTLGYVLVALGHQNKGTALLSEALQGAKSIGSASLQVISASQLQVAHNVAGTPDLGLAQAEGALALGDYSATPMLRSTLAHGYVLAGRAEEALGHLEWLIHNSQDPGLSGMAWARLSEVKVARGLDHRAALAEALSRFGATQLPSGRLEIVGAALEYGDPEQRAWAETALKSIDPDTLLSLHRAQFERLCKLVPTGEPVALQL